MRNYYVLLVFFLLSYSQKSLSQPYLSHYAGYESFAAGKISDEATELVVIASSGLKMREKPDINSKALEIIPFAARVRLVSDDEYNKMANPKIPFKLGKDSTFFHWEKVEFNKKIGYVCDGYLFEEIFTMTKPWAVNDGSMPLVGQGYRYYSMDLLTNDSIENVVTLKNHKPIFFVFNVMDTWDEDRLDFREVAINHGNRLEGYWRIYLVAKDSSNKINLQSRYRNFRINTYDPAQVQPSSFKISDRFSIDVEKKKIPSNYNPKIDFDEYSILIVDKSNKRKQMLEKIVDEGASITAFDDLDGDGFPDLMISQGYKGGGRTLLYLSSFAKKGFLLEEMHGLFVYDMC